jgi:ribosome-associated protein
MTESISTQVAEAPERTIDATPDYAPTPIDETDSVYQLAMLIADAADDRKGGDIMILRVGEVSSIAEYFVMVTGYSKVQVRAIANAVDEKVKDTLDREPLRSAGLSEGLWACIDYGDVVVHVQMPDQRDFYGLEAFWGHAPRIPFIAKPM